MRLSCKAVRVVLASTLVLCLGALPLAACSSGGSAADDAATTEEEVVEEEAEIEAEPEEEAVDEAVWVQTSEVYTATYYDDDSYNQSYLTTYTLDDAGNIVKETWSSADDDGSSYDYVNDEYGWPLYMTSEEDSDEDIIAATNEYDDEGRLVRSTMGESVTTYSYDADGNCIQRDYVSTAYQYDEDFNPIEGSGYTIHSTLTYGADGFLTSRMSDWGSKQLYEMAYEYGDDGRPTSCKVTLFSLDDDGNKVDEGYEYQDVTFTYDENGNVTRIETTNEHGTSTTEYEYTLVEHPSVAVAVESRLVSF